eukprot:GHUV01035664.1.p2 GENE.GHUV01035664.1~~GHUV01035664.1.p2  ORF type:complete len:108 (-),score=14.54 GHUV01035664.1:509-832(-)
MLLLGTCWQLISTFLLWAVHLLVSIGERLCLAGARLVDSSRQPNCMYTACRFAGSRLAGQRSVAGWVGESMGGLSYLEFIRTLSKRVEEDWQGVQVRVQRSHMLLML